MSYSLTLYPLTAHQFGSEVPLLTTGISLDTNISSDLTPMMAAGQFLYKNIYRHFDQGLKCVYKDSYGSMLKYLFAFEFQTQFETVFQNSDFDKAALQYLSSLPPMTPVVMYWS